MSSYWHGPEKARQSSFIPADGINLEVLKYYYTRFIDNDVNITEGRHPGDRGNRGYIIHSRKILNTTDIRDIMLDSRDWDEEQKRRARTGLPRIYYSRSETARRRLKNDATNNSKSSGHPSQMPANRYHANISALAFGVEVSDPKTPSTARQASFAPQSAAKNAMDFENQHRRAQRSDYRTDRQDLQSNLSKAAAHSDPIDIDEETGLSDHRAQRPSIPGRHSVYSQATVSNREQPHVKMDPRYNHTLRPPLSYPQQHSYSPTTVLPNPFDSMRCDQSASKTNRPASSSHTASANSGMTHRPRYGQTSLVSHRYADDDDDRMYGRRHDPNQNSNRYKAPQRTSSVIEQDSGDEMYGSRSRSGRAIDSAPETKSRALDRRRDNKRYEYQGDRPKSFGESRSVGKFLDRLEQNPPLAILFTLYGLRPVMPGEADWSANYRVAESDDIALRRRFEEIILRAARAKAPSNLSEYELRSILYNYGLEICIINDFKVLGQTFLELGADGRGIGPLTNVSFVSLAERLKSHAMLEILRILCSDKM